MAITIDGASPLTSVNPNTSSVVGTEVRLVPRLQENEQFRISNGMADYGNVCCKVSGVNGLTPTFRVDLAAGPHYYFPWQASEPGYFSYDGIAWYRMANAASFNGNYVYCSHSVAFNQDTVWFARNERVSTDCINNWLNVNTGWQNGLLSQLSGGVDFVVDTIASQTDDLGRTIAAQPIYAFGIVSGKPKRQAVILCGGTHAAEDYAQVCYMKAIEWLCGSDAQAIALRAAFDFLCFPMINPSGRMGGGYRGTFSYNGPSNPEGGVGNDVNRHFNDFPAPFDTVTKIRAVMETELANRYLRVISDWHTGAAAPGPSETYAVYSDSGEPVTLPAFRTRLGINNGNRGAGDCGQFPLSSIGHWGHYTAGAPLAALMEFAQASTVLVPGDANGNSSATLLGKGVLLSLYDVTQAGLFDLWLDVYAAQTTVKDTSSVSGTTITLRPRTTVCEEFSGWADAAVKVSNVYGKQPLFKIDLSTGQNNGQVWENTENGFFSYDGINWTEFGTAVSYPTGFIQCQHNAAFTQNDVWFSRYRIEGVAQIRYWLDNDLKPLYDALLFNLTGGSNYVVDTYSAQTDERGNAVAATPLFGFAIKTGGAGKQKIVLTSGVHANEHWGTTVYKKAIEWLLARQDVAAVKLTDAFDIICLPLLNAPGREGGHFRSQWEVSGGHSDLNRRFSDVSNLFETVTKPRTVLNTEVANGNMAACLDFHGFSTPGSQKVAWWNPVGQSNFAAFESALINRLGWTGGGSPLISGMLVDWAQNTKGCSLATIIENSSASIDTLSNATLWSAEVMTALADVIAPAPAVSFGHAFARRGG